jgi:hypothetical protein
MEGRGEQGKEERRCGCEGWWCGGSIEWRGGRLLCPAFWDSVTRTAGIWKKET